MQPTTPPSRNQRVDAEQRAQLLEEFERSGLSAAAFARQHSLNYTTFCSWRHARPRRAQPDFVQVEVPTPKSAELVIELGADVRVRVSTAEQVALAAQLLQNFKSRQPC